MQVPRVRKTHSSSTGFQTTLGRLVGRVYRKRKLALIIPAHNEELVIESTIRSALAAGLDSRDIYVVSDASTDNTVELARALIMKSHVLPAPRGGKAGAIKRAIDHYRLAERYLWVHIADADGNFKSDYFSILQGSLDESRFVAATGHVQSLPGCWVSQYRLYEYTIGLEIVKRIQAWLGTITVIPGATACISTAILKDLDFLTHSLTEDFDITLQIHRKKLGKIAYIPSAKCYTQDPANYHDYKNQIRRWYRGFWQGVVRHRVGLRPRRLDAYVNFILAETFVFAAEILALPFIIAFAPHPAFTAASIFVGDLLVFLSFVVFAAALNKRWDILEPFPLFYLLRFTNLYIFMAAFVEVVLLKRFKSIKPGWETASRRYRIQTGSI